LWTKLKQRKRSIRPFRNKHSFNLIRVGSKKMHSNTWRTVHSHESQRIRQASLQRVMGLL
jgi:hypothetical protein